MMTDSPHSLLCRAFEVRFEWNEIVHDLALPKSRRELTTDNALHFIKHGYERNANRFRGKQALNLAQEYLTISQTKTVKKK